MWIWMGMGRGRIALARAGIVILVSIILRFYQLISVHIRKVELNQACGNSNWNEVFLWVTIYAHLVIYFCRAFLWTKGVGKNATCLVLNHWQLHGLILLDTGAGYLYLNQGFSLSHTHTCTHTRAHAHFYVDSDSVGFYQSASWIYLQIPWEC